MTSYIKLFGLLAVTVFLLSSCKKDDEKPAVDEILGEYIGPSILVDYEYLYIWNASQGYHYAWVADTTIVNPDRLVVSLEPSGAIKFTLKGQLGLYEFPGFVFTPSETGEYKYHTTSVSTNSSSNNDQIQETIININVAEKHLTYRQTQRFRSRNIDDYIEFEGWKK